MKSVSIKMSNQRLVNIVLSLIVVFIVFHYFVKPRFMERFNDEVPKLVLMTEDEKKKQLTTHLGESEDGYVNNVNIVLDTFCAMKGTPEFQDMIRCHYRALFNGHPFEPAELANKLQQCHDEYLKAMPVADKMKVLKAREALKENIKHIVKQHTNQAFDTTKQAVSLHAQKYIDSL